MNETATATVKLVNKRGLHARASNKFMECVLRFNAEVLVRSHNDVCAETVVADSVMELLLLGSACGEEITISAIGCLLYTSPSPRDQRGSRMPSSA